MNRSPAGRRAAGRRKPYAARLREGRLRRRPGRSFRSRLSPAGQDLLVQAARLGHGFDIEFLGQDARAVAVLSHRRVEMAEASEMCHERPMDALSARVVDEDLPAYRHRLRVSAAGHMAFRHVGQHFQVNLMQPFALFGAPIGVDIFLQVVAPVQALRLPVAMERFLPLSLALLGGTLADAPLEDLGIHPDGFAPEYVGLAGRFHDIPAHAGGAQLAPKRIYGYLEPLPTAALVRLRP